MKTLTRFLSIFVVLGCLVLPINSQAKLIPVTKAVLEDSPSLYSEESISPLTSFIISVYNSNKYSIRGLYVKDVLEFPVVQQPTNNPGFVSSLDGTVTQFGIASNYGSIGILAHNNLAGSEFSAISPDDTIVVVYGDGHLATYDVTEVREYQALSPNSPYSSFVDLSQADQTITYEQLFYDTYGISDRLVMQTCIEKDGIDSWGRLFIIAEKMES